MKKVLTSGGKAVLVGGKAMVGSVTNEPVQESDINFYDYDGTLLHAWSLAELQSKTELPELPTQPGLICQGWNWTLAELKSQNSEMDVGANYITSDGKTRIYIHLEEGRTSPMVSLGVNGTVSVDWGDGTEPDTLTGTDVSTAVWTPAHSYAAAGDYVIKLAVTGSAELLSQASGSTVYACLLRNTADVADKINFSYMDAIRRIELGANTGIAQTGGFGRCYKLAAVSLPLGISSIGDAAFLKCYQIGAIIIPSGATAAGNRFAASIGNDVRVCMPPTLATIGNQAFSDSLMNRVRIPKSVKTMGYSIFNGCNALTVGVIPEGITSLSTYSFYGSTITSADIRSKKFSVLNNSTFEACASLACVKIPSNIRSIYNNCFSGDGSLAVLDFTEHTAVPNMKSTNALEGTADDLEIRVPAALADAWKAATNWATYADHIVGV